MAAELEVPFLGRVPLYQPIRVGGDTGVPIVIGEPDSPAAIAIRRVAEQAAAQVSISSYKKTIPLTQVR
jgi:ATP-binding protein involved in chromosome partitioning